MTGTGLNSQLAIAAHILAVLAHCGGETVTSDELAEGFGTNPVVVRRVLAQLNRRGLIESRRGVGGGSVLARPAEEITMRDAYTAVAAEDGTLLPRHPGAFSRGSAVVPIIAGYLNELYAGAEEALLESLEAVTVAQLVQTVQDRARALGIAQQADPQE